MLEETPPSGNGYEAFLGELKDRIRTAQVRAGMAVNRELVLLYWNIGREILTRQEQHRWGAKVIARLARDLRQAFPGMQGWSARNLHYMRAFAEAYPDAEFVQAVLAQITWFHNVILLDRVKDPAIRNWYLAQVLHQGWSGRQLMQQIAARTHERQGQATTNFPHRLPAPQSDLAQQILKDPYNFDFLTLTAAAQERDLERGLLAHIREFLLELGVGFAFVGSQYRIEVDGQDFFIDLLFYHLHLRCYVVIDLKVGEFQPEFAGKLNFYLSAVDDLLRRGDDQPSIGIILCKTQSKVIAEYALRDVHKPMGVATYQLAAALPEQLQSSLPTVAELEAELGGNE
ncbi:MAG: PDDEXK nuclease domain-containing protein [Chloroflexota bacterium]|nr:PDDEXK nuclease domain-containing protein [Chloroflexota bacterium]